MCYLRDHFKSTLYYVKLPGTKFDRKQMAFLCRDMNFKNGNK